MNGNRKNDTMFMGHDVAVLNPVVQALCRAYGIDIDHDGDRFLIKKCALSDKQLADLIKADLEPEAQYHKYPDRCAIGAAYALICPNKFGTSQHHFVVNAFLDQIEGQYNEFVVDAVLVRFAENCDRWPCWADVKECLDLGVKYAGEMCAELRAHIGAKQGNS